MNQPRFGAIVAGAAIVLGISGCAFSPLAHRIKVGEEAFVVFVGEGRDRHTDLFAVPANGGAVSQVTFTALIEMHPQLTPTGEMVVFLRMRDTLPGQRRDVVVVNLLSYGETVIAIPDSAGRPDAVAWSDDATTLYLRTDRGLWRTAAPPAPVAVIAVARGDSAAADSALETWLGRPRFARAVRCLTGGVCVIGPNGDTAALAPAGRGAMRWGDDSVGWFQDDGIVVRSLGPSQDRVVTLKDGPANPRDASVAPLRLVRSRRDAPASRQSPRSPPN